MLEDPSLSAQNRACLQMIQQNATRLTAQTQSMMDLAKGKEEEHREASISPLVEEICHAAEISCRKKNIALEKDLSATRAVRMDPISLEGAIHNLVNNAIDATPAGGRLTVKTFETDGQVAVQIRDTGHGMEKKSLKKILSSPFHTSKSNGTGLGLFITQRILKSHRARLKWQTAPGQGTTVTILFLVFMLFLVQSPVHATPQLLRIQGHFTDNQATPLTDTLPVRFSVWDSADGYGNLLWQDVQNLYIHDNTFQVVLGRLSPLPSSVFSGGDRWLEMQIGNDAPLRPRHKIPAQVIQAQMAAPPPPMTSEERRELELQIDGFKEPEPITPPTPKIQAPPVVAAPPTPAPAPAPAPASTPKPVHHHKDAVKVVKNEETGESQYVYVVQAGDTLKSIALDLYGNADKWVNLYYPNQDRLGPMGNVFTGQILVLPNKYTGEITK